MRKAPVQDDYPRLTLRLPPHLHAALTDEADRIGRSLNAHIIHKLSADPVASALEEIKRQNKSLAAVAQEILECVQK